MTRSTLVKNRELETDMNDRQKVLPHIERDSDDITSPCDVEKLLNRGSTLDSNRRMRTSKRLSKRVSVKKHGGLAK